MGRGQLLFKGEKSKKKKNKSKHSNKTDETAAAAAAVLDQSSSTAAAPAGHIVSQDQLAATTKQAEAPKMASGRGEITTSGTVVTGYDTRFRKDLQVGDAFLVDIAGQQEMRVVTMLLSDISINLSSAFSQNVSKPAPFQLIRKPKNVVKEAKEAAKDAEQSERDLQQLAFGTYGTTEELVYREKTEHGSYRIKRVKVDGKDLTRGDLLHMRSKKKHDKYC